MLEQYDLEQSPDYRKGWDDGRKKGYEVGHRHGQAAKPVDADGARFIIAHLCNTFPELAHCHPARQQQQAAEPVTDEENEQFSEDVSNFKGADPEATKFALEQFLKRRGMHPAPTQQAAPDAYNRKLRQQLEQEWTEVRKLREAEQAAPTQQPLTIPRDVVEAAQLMQDGDYRGPLFLARKVFDWVAAHGITGSKT